MLKFNNAFRIAKINVTLDGAIIPTGIAGPIGNDFTSGDYAKIMIKKSNEEYIIMSEHYIMKVTDTITPVEFLRIHNELQTNPSTDSISNFLSLCCNLKERGETFSMESEIDSVKVINTSIDGDPLLSSQIDKSYELDFDPDLKRSIDTPYKYLFTIKKKPPP